LTRIRTSDFFHFTPTYWSWLNRVEIWFAKIERDVIARSVFTSVTDLSPKLMKYIRAYAKTARPFSRKHTDIRRRTLTRAKHFTKCLRILFLASDGSSRHSVKALVSCPSDFAGVLIGSRPHGLSKRRRFRVSPLGLKRENL
jgi:hypothetical protein